ncbi:MAG: GGDEF and EAL domain-containing protein [Bacilli bacterium]|nr:GGDEF and EAL domain-containing protein [Bacilli bacterium]MBN2877669.1 GGDEF and EAL domain-containing protein [Bacilli bacterium]
MRINLILATGAQALEIVVAIILIIVTIVALFFLYRNVAYELAELRKNKKAMRERDENGEEEKEPEVLEKKDIKNMSLLALIDHSIRTAKEGTLATLYMINIDNFRQVVDSATVQKDIDKVIAEIEKKLKKYGAKNAIAGHLQKDIFLFYYTGIVDAESISQIGDDLLNLFREPLRSTGEEITASIGVVVFPYDGINSEQLFKNAEVAVYVAKKAGKNRLHMYSEDLIETEQHNAEYYQEIKRSISNDEFLLYYQTIVDVKSGKIIGLESLLRWKHPTKGILPPGKFLNVMELTGDITWFGTWGFEKNVMQYKNWRSKTRIGDLFISTNLSPKQLEVDGLAKQFFNITKKYGMSPELFCLEINNYYSLTKNRNAMNNINQFRKYGFRLAIDDLGHNHEIIEDMKDLQAGIVKLDRENVLMIMDGSSDIDVINRILREAKERSKVVIAEGIENEEMIKSIFDLGVRFMQGYYFNQPKSVIEIEKMIMESPWNADSFSNIIDSRMEV